jgi:hypothetical protein
MQADLRAAKSAAEQRLGSLEESCHAKIEALQAAHAEQLCSQQVIATSQISRSQLRRALMQHIRRAGCSPGEA